MTYVTFPILLILPFKLAPIMLSDWAYITMLGQVILNFNIAIIIALSNAVLSVSRV